MTMQETLVFPTSKAWIGHICVISFSQLLLHARYYMISHLVILVTLALYNTCVYSICRDGVKHIIILKVNNAQKVKITS